MLTNLITYYKHNFMKSSIIVPRAIGCLQNNIRLWSSVTKKQEDRDRNKLVLGCGSNVVDQIHKVQAVPNVGEKGFFLSPVKTLEKSIVGGVTLNHLVWASFLGVPTGLLALQGYDKAGRLIRKSLREHNVCCDFIQVKKTYTSAESFVLLQPDGERSIIMAPGATSLIDGNVVKEDFSDEICSHANMLTTEISQVPLSAVIELLKIAKENKILSVLDFDVSPKVAFNEAKLGNLEELKEVLSLADVIKPAKHAAQGLLQLLRPELKDSLHPEDIVKFLQDVTNAKLIAMTHGGKDTILAVEDHMVSVPVVRIDEVVDATGAGDAFLGGLIAGMYFNGLPSSENDLRSLGDLANKVGACNCLCLGALPVESSRTFLDKEIKSFSSIKRSSEQNADVDDGVASNICKHFQGSLQTDINATQEIMKCIDLQSVSTFVDFIDNCSGNVLTSAIGKSGLVANRLAASLSSIGVPAHFVHTSEWSHGDLGKIHEDDVVIFISHSGNTDEVIYAAELVQLKHIPVLCILGFSDSVLGKMCTSSICYSNKQLSEPLGGIPTTSIILQDAIINGIMCELIHCRKLTRQDFVVNHPGGSLGRKFSENEE